jgi:NAD(P)-dependent dehydrogenase (short-subunit alcohol dehydrogenase family)
MLDQKIIVVSGAAGLLGRTFAEGIAARGGTVIVADIDHRRATELAGRLADLHAGRARAFPLDITDVSSVQRLIAETDAAFGRIDGVVNSAYPRNHAYGRKVEEVTYQDFCENSNSHLGGYFLMMQQFAKRLASSGGGSIVNMSSIYGVIAPRFEVYEDTSMTMPVEYAAIKAGILHLTRYFAKYYRRDGVRVNAVSPGGIFDSQPASFLERYAAHAGAKGMLSADDIFGSIAFLLSDDARYVTGQNLVVDDGFAL